MIDYHIVDKEYCHEFSLFIADMIWPGENKDFGKCQCLAILENNKVIGGVIYHNYYPEAGVVELSAASKSKRWLTRKVLNVMFEIPFKNWGCQAVCFRVADDNKPMHRMLISYGCSHHIIPRLRGRYENENIFLLTEEQYVSNKFNMDKSNGQT